MKINHRNFYLGVWEAWAADHNYRDVIPDTITSHRLPTVTYTTDEGYQELPFDLQNLMTIINEVDEGACFLFRFWISPEKPILVDIICTEGPGLTYTDYYSRGFYYAHDYLIDVTLLTPQ